MFRFLSGRKARGTATITTNGTSDHQKGHHNYRNSVQNKNLIQCKVILLDGTDLSVELSVSINLVFLVSSVFDCVPTINCVGVFYSTFNSIVTLIIELTLIFIPVRFDFIEKFA